MVLDVVPVKIDEKLLKPLIHDLMIKPSNLELR
jgi:hypothetical protein